MVGNGDGACEVDHGSCMFLWADMVKQELRKTSPDRENHSLSDEVKHNLISV